MILVKKVAVPPWNTESTIQGPSGAIRLLQDRVVPGGGWHHVMHQGLKDTKPKPTAVLYCPGCGKEGMLTDYKIFDDGTLDASVLCPHEPCTFHDKVQLVGYER